RYHSDNAAQPTDKLTCTASRFYSQTIPSWNETLTVSDGRGGSNAITVAITPGVPATPSNLVALSKVPGSVDLSWTDNSSNETRFEVTRDGALVASVGANVTSVSFSNLSPGVSYHWDLRACNASGCSPYQGVVGKTPDGSDGVPIAPSHLAVVSPVA